MGVFVSFPQNPTKLMQLHQYNTTAVHKCYDEDHVAKWEFCDLVPSGDACQRNQPYTPCLGIKLDESQWRYNSE